MKLAVAGLALLVIGCGRAPEATEAPEPAPKRDRPGVTMHATPLAVGDRMVLATAPINARQQFEVSIGACEQVSCPVLVSLTEQNVSLDQQRTGFDSSSREARQVELQAGFGAGDPAGPPAGLKAWATGEGDKFLATTVRVLELARGFNALLIDQVQGTTEPKRRHELYGLLGDKLTRLWESSEGAGPAMTSTAVLGDRRAIVYFDGFRYTTTNRPDTLVSMLVTWNPGSERVEYGSPSEFLRAVLVPGYATVEAARGAQRQCLGSYFVLSGKTFAEAGRSGFVLLLPTVDESVAKARHGEAEKCLGGNKAQVVPMR